MKKKRGLKESKTRLSTRVVVADHQERSIRKGPSLVPPAQPSTINEWATPIIELQDSEKNQLTSAPIQDSCFNPPTFTYKHRTEKIEYKRIYQKENDDTLSIENKLIRPFQESFDWTFPGTFGNTRICAEEVNFLDIYTLGETVVRSK
jgi:hypothetical protein